MNDNVGFLYTLYKLRKRCLKIYTPEEVYTVYCIVIPSAIAKHLSTDILTDRGSSVKLEKHICL